jgi:hypothetical protein
MSSNSTCPPVLILAFNRPDTTRRVLEAVRAARPSRLYLAVDGPRANRPGDVAAVREVRGLTREIDWDCDTRAQFAEHNLGCKVAVSQAITWFFSEVEAGIILEDDCVADPSFFPYAADLLERYRDDNRIAMVSGDNFEEGRRRTTYSYYFSRYAHIWGWATWRRAWRWYDHRMRLWPELREGGWLMDVLGDAGAVQYWTRILDETCAERNTSWAYRWMFSIWVQSGLAILPNVNLVSNIGFGELATHTVAQGSVLASLRTTSIEFPLSHPPYVIRDQAADSETQRRVFSIPPLWRRVATRTRRALMSVTGG